MSVSSLYVPIERPVAEYFDYLSNSHSVLGAAVDSAADQILSHGNAAFRKEDVVQTGAIPADIAREDLLQVTLTQISICAARASLPTSVVVSANHGRIQSREQQTAIENNLDLIHRFRDAHPNLPFSHFEATNGRHTPIGNIRETLFAGTARAYQHLDEDRDPPIRNRILTNWDADTVRAEPDYFNRLQATYGRATAIAWMASQSVQSDRLDNDRFPDANRLLGWAELAEKGSLHTPAHFSANVGAFVLGRGFRGAYGDERLALYSSALAAAGSDDFTNDYLPDIELVVSPRRLVAQMFVGEPPGYTTLHSDSPDPNTLQLRRDVSPDYFDIALAGLVTTVLYNQLSRYNEDHGQHPGQHPDTLDQAAVDYAVQVARSGVRTFGDVHDTSETVEGAITLFERRHRSA